MTEMDASLNIPAEACAYILFQRTEFIKFTKKPWWPIVRRIDITKSLYPTFVRRESKLRHSEISLQYSNAMNDLLDEIRPFLPQQVKTILDIGCGIGGIDILLKRHYDAQQPVIYLLDKTKLDRHLWYGFEPSGAYYNSLEIARETQIMNGANPEFINVLEAPDDGKIVVPQSIDLVISMISWGFHYPVEVYLDSVHSIMSQGATLLLDVRKNTEGRRTLEKRFDNAEIVLEEGKRSLVRCIKR